MFLHAQFYASRLTASQLTQIHPQPEMEWNETKSEINNKIITTISKRLTILRVSEKVSQIVIDTQICARVRHTMKYNKMLIKLHPLAASEWIKYQSVYRKISADDIFQHFVIILLCVKYFFNNISKNLI